MPKDLMTTCPQKSSVMIKPARNSLILMDLPKLKLGSASKSERLLSLQAMQPHQDRRSALPLLLSVATVWPLWIWYILHRIPKWFLQTNMVYCETQHERKFVYLWYYMYLILIVYDFSMTTSVYFQDRNISFWGSSSSRCISPVFPLWQRSHLEHGKKCPFKMKFDELSIRHDDFP
jgi:hypothetical protein